MIQFTEKKLVCVPLNETEVITDKVKGQSRETEELQVRGKTFFFFFTE